MNPEPGLTLSHYRLVEKIGEGGMGVVWKAEDTVLGRTVAIKILPAALALDEERRSMFLDEARMASSVSHGNIVQVHEMGRDSGLDFIVMEHIEGQTLARLLHGRPVPAENIAEWGLQVAQGLSRAHRKGLLHRDLKPANILVTTEGEAKIVDFGLATLFAPDGDSMFTATQLLEDQGPERKIAGTLPYMSPEQVRGEKLDSRSDIFSFGTILYEMTTGQRPFIGSTPSELARDIQNCRPQPVHEVVPKVPAELHRIIEKALARRPEDRYQGMGDMAVDLKRLSRDLESGSSPSYEELKRLLRPAGRHRLRMGLWAASVLAVATAAVLLGPRILDLVKGPTGPGASTLAVLPFESLGHSGAEGTRPGFAFSEDVTTRLSRIAGLEVLSPLTTRSYAGQTLDHRRIGEELRVGSILAGSVQEGEQGIRVSVHLIAVDRGSDVWAGQFLATADGMAAVQDSIVTGVTEALGVVPPSDLAMPVSRRWTKNQKAYAYFLAGMEQYLVGRSLHPVADARYWFDRALRLDPGYAPAIAMQGELAAREFSMDAVRRPGAIEKAYELVDRALELDPALPVGVLAKARVLAEDARLEEALQTGEQALQANPRIGYTYRVLGALYEAAGRDEKAIETVTRGIEVDDSRPRAYHILGRLYRRTEDLTRAESTIRAGLERYPGDPLLSRDLAGLLDARGLKEEALEMRREGLATDPDDYHWYVALMNQLRDMDRGAEADSVAALLKERWPDEPRALDWAGWHLMKRGDRETAMKLFEKALQLEPYYEPARSNLAWCLEQEKRFDEAEAVYKKGIELVPDDLNPALSLALFHERRDRFDKAETLLIQRSKERPDRWGLMIDVARFYNRRNRHDLAEKWARKAMEAAPDAARPYNQLGWECWHQERFEEARAAFLEAVHRSDEWESYWGLARSLTSLNRADSAETVMETWVRKRPDHASGWHNLGWVRQQSGKMNQAAAAYEKELELRPHSSGALNNLAMFYGQMGRREKQLEMFRRATEIDSTNAVAWMNLADTYYVSGDDERAWAAADRASSLAGDNDLFSANTNFILARVERRRAGERESAPYLSRALERIDRALHDSPQDPDVLSSATLIHGMAGDLQNARRYADKAFRRQAGDPGLIYALACGLALGGDRDGAFKYLRAAIAAGWGDRRALEEDPDLEGIRGDVRFGEVVGEVQ